MENAFILKRRLRIFWTQGKTAKKKVGRLYEPKNGLELKNIAKIAHDVIGITVIGNKRAWIGILHSATGAPASVKEGTMVYDSNGLNIQFNLYRWGWGQQHHNCIEVFTQASLQGKVFNEHCSRIRSSICEL